MLEEKDHHLANSDASDTTDFWNNRVNIYDKLSLTPSSLRHSCCACKSGVR